MLRVFLAVTLLYVVSGQSYSGSAPAVPVPYGQPTGYGQPSYGPDPLLVEVNNLVNNVSVLSSNDASLDIRIRNLAAQDAINSALTERFQNEIFPGFRKAQASQNAQITNLENQAREILRVSDDVGEIANTISQLQSQLDDLEAVKANNIRPAIAALRDADAAQDARLDNIDNGLDHQEARIDELFRRSAAVRERIVKMRNTLHEVFDVLNSETAETLEFTLTSQEPEQTKCLSATFNGRTPSYQYGFTGIHVSDHSQSFVLPAAPAYPQRSYGYGPSGYGQSSVNQIQDNPNIYWDVDVDYDAGTNKATVRLYDLSDNGWSVDRVTVSVVFFRIDNRIISTYAS